MVHPFPTLHHSTFPRVISVLAGMLLIGSALLWQLLSVSAATLHPRRQSEDVRTLASGAPVEREISGGQTHSYLITLNAGEYLRVVISSRSIGLNPELFAPNNPIATGIYGIHSMMGSRTVSLIAAVAGNHKLTIRPVGNNAKTGRYEVKIETLRPATEPDKIRLDAERAEWSGSRKKDLTPEKWREAIADFQEALTLWQKADDHNGQLRMLTRLGSEHTLIGEHQIALNYFKDAIHIAQTLGDRYQEANLLLGFGNVYTYQNESQKALDLYIQARQIFASRSAKFGEAIAIESIGMTYLNLGDTQTALEYLNQASQTFSSLKFAGAQCNALNGIGAAYSKNGQPQQAIESYNQALALARESRTTACEGRTLRHMGDAYLYLGERQKALEYFDEGLKICRAVGNRICEAAALRGIGSISWLSGDKEKSLDLLGQALNKFRLSGERSQEATTLQRLAQINQSLGNLNEARGQIEQALEIMESLRADVASQRLRESFFVTAQNSFAFYIDLLMRMHRKYPAEGYDAMALKANERAHARGLLEILAEAGADIRQGVSPNLLELERSLQRQINAKAAARGRLLNDKRAEAQAASLDREISELTSRFREAQAQIRLASPRYAALTQPQPLSSEEIQRHLLDQNTVLLEFSLGPGQSWLWAVTHQSLDSYSLPPENELGAAARKVYELLTSRQPKKAMTPSRRRQFISESDAKFTTEISALSRMLLSPIAPKLRQEWKGKRLLIVASGALEYLPFAALTLPSENNYQPLIASHEVVNLPSASALAALRRETAGRKPAVKTLAVIADPVFDPNDPRVSLAAKRNSQSENLVASVRSAEEAQAASNVTTNLTLGRAMRSFNRAGFSRLPFSREEADNISGLVPKSSLLKATDFLANRTIPSSGELSHYRIVHFATHGLLNSEYPELSGLVLSLVDENGKTQDGFLRMHEIFNLNIPADLVVLSACQTALGKEIKGEGLVGLTRGFMYAGAERVVASLWQVDDLATAELMKRFYRGMLQNGLRPAAALRVAQIEMMKQKRWASPYFWAAFTLQGEWR